VKERPILFSAPMIRAILNGEKTQTRRVVKPQPTGTPWFWEGDEVDPQPQWFDSWETGRDVCGAHLHEVNNPMKQRYAKGDHLWVREAWLDAWAQNLGHTSTQYHYRADPGNEHYGYKWRPSIHMPRAASRITLKVTDVRVQRLQDISEEDARAEGVEDPNAERLDPDWKICPRCGGTGLYDHHSMQGCSPDSDCLKCDTYKKRFGLLWESINGQGSWDTNPWVYALTFERAKP
jgi:hypothetical protein